MSNTRRIQSRLAALLLLTSCVTHFNVGNAEISCETDDDCPKLRLCQRTTHLCLSPEAVDNSVPTLTQVTPLHHEAIRLSFSEPMDVASIAPLGAYTITPALMVKGAFVEDAQSVLLSVASQTTGTAYILTLTGGRDVAGNPLSSMGVAFVGLGPTADPLPPDPLQPEKGAVIYGSSTTLKWAARQLATSYEVGVALDSSFSSMISGSPFTVAGTELTLSGLQARTYYWRVRSNTTRPGEYGVSELDVVRDRVRVYCGADCDSARGVGNLTRPLTHIADGIQVAAAQGLTRVDIAARPSGLSYVESFSLQAGVDVYGGYDASFNDATRDPVNKQVKIRGVGADTVTAVEIRDTPTRVEGLDIVGDATDHSQALFVFFSNSLTFSHCSVTGASGEGTKSIGVKIDRTDGSGQPVFDDCVLRAGDGYDYVAALVAVFGSPVLHRNRITGGTPADGGVSYAIARDDSETHAGVWSNNIIAGGDVSGSSTSVGAVVSGGNTVTNNVIYGGVAGSTGRSVALRARGAASVTNNVLFTRSSSYGVCLERAVNPFLPSDPDGNFRGSLRNNVFADCATASARLNAPSGNCAGPHDNCASVSGINTNAAMGAQAATGNVDGVSASNVFVSATDFHLSMGSPAKSAGLTAAFPICGVVGVSTCGSVTNDFDLTLRTPPFSCGVFERDN